MIKLLRIKDRIYLINSKGRKKKVEEGKVYIEFIELRRSQRNRKTGLHGFNFKNWRGGGVFYSEPQFIKGDSIRQFTVKSADKRKENFLKLGIHWKVGWT